MESILLSIFATLLPYKKSDSYCVYHLLRKSLRWKIVLPIYVTNGYLPSSIPTSLLECSTQDMREEKNHLLVKMKYYRALELGRKKDAIEYYSFLHSFFLKSKYLADKCEILFYLAVVEQDMEKAKKLQKITFLYFP